MWDTRRTAHRAGLVALLAAYLALMAALIYGNAASRQPCRPELPAHSVPLR